MLTHVIVILGSLWAGCFCASVVPTPRQYEYMEMGFTQFMHFSVTTFGQQYTGKDVEHDCIGGKCLPAIAFNPTNLSTDQWVQTPVNMGAHRGRKRVQ